MYILYQANKLLSTQYYTYNTFSDLRAYEVDAYIKATCDAVRK